MRQEDAVFAGEVSGHYYFRDFYQADSGTVPALLMLELLSRRGEKLSELLRPYRERYFLSGEINTPVDGRRAEAPGAQGALRPRGRGLPPRRHLVTAEDWHMNVRPSNTEPLLRLNLEALDGS